MNLSPSRELEVYIERVLPRLVVNGDCVECTIGDNGNGYCYIHARPNRWAVHRLVYTIFRGEIPSGLHVLHECDNRRCSNPYHLFVGTQKDNMQDKMKKGRATGPHFFGETNPAAKLTWEKVREIRSSQGTYKDLSAAYGVSGCLIGKIKRNEIWKTDGL